MALSLNRGLFVVHHKTMLAWQSWNVLCTCTSQIRLYQTPQIGSSYHIVLTLIVINLDCSDTEKPRIASYHIQVGHGLWKKETGGGMLQNNSLFGKIGELGKNKKSKEFYISWRRKGVRCCEMLVGIEAPFSWALTCSNMGAWSLARIIKSLSNVLWSIPF